MFYDQVVKLKLFVCKSSIAIVQIGMLTNKHTVNITTKNDKNRTQPNLRGWLFEKAGKGYLEEKPFEYYSLLKNTFVIIC